MAVRRAPTVRAPQRPPPCLSIVFRKYNREILVPLRIAPVRLSFTHKSLTQLDQFS